MCVTWITKVEEHTHFYEGSRGAYGSVDKTKTIVLITDNIEIEMQSIPIACCATLNRFVTHK